MKEKIVKIIEIIKKKYIWLILFMSLVIFLEILQDVCIQEKIMLDNIFYRFAVIFLRRPILTEIMKVITFFGSAYFILSLTFLLITVIKNKKIVLLIITNLILITSMNIILKNIVQRPRPEGYRLVEESGYSFPSGHSMVSVAFYGFLIYLILAKFKNKTLKIALSVLLGILVLLIAFSRIYLGVHYATDVLAGGLLSISYLVAFISYTKKWIDQDK